MHTVPYCMIHVADATIVVDWFQVDSADLVDCSEHYFAQTVILRASTVAPSFVREARSKRNTYDTLRTERPTPSLPDCSPGHVAYGKFGRAVQADFAGEILFPQIGDISPPQRV